MAQEIEKASPENDSIVSLKYIFQRKKEQGTITGTRMAQALTVEGIHILCQSSGWLKHMKVE